MNEKLAAAAASTKDFVSRHKVALTAAATVTVCVVVQTRIANSWNEFLDERGLTEEYYNSLEDEAV